MTIFKDIPSDICHSPIWSPDGSKIVFHIIAEEQWHLGIVNADGSGFHLVNAEGESFALAVCTPAWARDGKSIFYNSDKLYHIDLDGTVLRKWELSKVLTERGPNGDANLSGLNMSPNGRTLLMDVDLGEGNNVIFAFDLDTEKTTRVTAKEDVAFYPCWLTNDEFLCVIFREKEKHGNMRSIYRVYGSDKIAKLLIKDAMNPSVSAP